MGILEKLFKTDRINELEEENNKLKDNIKECNQKLIDKQEHINKTNAFWKKKFFERKGNSVVKKEL